MARQPLRDALRAGAPIALGLYAVNGWPHGYTSLGVIIRSLLAMLLIGPALAWQKRFDPTGLDRDPPPG